MPECELSPDELTRYARQIGRGVLSPEGQLRLKNSAALVTRTGGPRMPAFADCLTLPDGAAVDEALGVLAALMPEGKSLPKSCLVAVSGAHVGTVASHRPRVLRDGDELVLIAPVAGG